MKSNFAIGAAGLAIAMSLGTAAQARGAEDVGIAYGPQEGDVTAPAAIAPMTEGLLSLSDFKAYNKDQGEAAIAAPVATYANDDAMPATIDLAPVAVDLAPVAFNAFETAPLGAVVAPLASAPAQQPLTGLVTQRSADVDPFYGNIDPWYGNIDPFYGDIDAFWGTINPFYGDINPFYGNIDPFWGDISPFYGDIVAFWGDIAPFWGDINPFYGDIVAFENGLQDFGDFWQGHTSLWQQIDDVWGTTNLLGLPDPATSTLLNQMVADARAQFGSKVLTKTGQTFDEVITNQVFARHGIDPNDLSSLAGKSATDRARFFLDWHDTLNQYSGFDAVDHWMRAVNWSPAVTQQQGEGGDAVIGIIDAHFNSNQVKYRDGKDGFVNGHGAGVASLILAPHDGEGTMGIAPNATVVAYNPFDQDGNATWHDIADGIAALKTQSYSTWWKSKQKVSIVNLSLGEKGYAFSPNIAQVFSDDRVLPHVNNTIYVLAAGNEGIAQTTNVEWTSAADTDFILVGSIDPTGNISSFSNTPGEACLIVSGQCDKLKNHFIVAPGEMLLVDDGNGNLVRRSGTSFAAPLVSGTIALLHDFWPWLAQNPEETAEIIFKTARDLGAPGVDEVYGWGLLDVTAAMSPIDFNNAEFTIYGSGLSNKDTGTKSARNLLRGGFNASWETGSAHLTLIEDIGNTYRDFFVPLSSVLYGSTYKGEYFQQFIQDRFMNWLLSSGNDSNGDGKAGLSDLRGRQTQRLNEWSLKIDATAPRLTDDGYASPSYMAATLAAPGGKIDFTFGRGQGSLALTNGRFNLASDHDAQVGGVNPVLGFAAGDTFAAMGYNLAPKTRLTVGFTENSFDLEDLEYLSATDLLQVQGLNGYDANAFTVGIEHQLSKAVEISAQYTRLNENEAVLGTQATDAAFLGNGSDTDALTLAAELDMGRGLAFDVSMTASRTALADGQGFGDNGGIWGTAAQISATKTGVMGKRDIVRFSLAQPLNIERGEISFDQLEVIDRQTGELGRVTQTFSIEGQRQLVGEAVYATPIGDLGELGIYGRYQTAGSPGETENYVIGTNLSIRF